MALSLPQFRELSRAVNKTYIQDRVGAINDGCAMQAAPADRKKYDRALYESIGEKAPGSKTQSDFLTRVGKGF